MRAYHSPSSIDLGRRCRRAWFYRYIVGIRRPEPVWREDLMGRDRSLALGKALHATLEAHFTPGGKPNWIWFPGEVAAAGVALLPDPVAKPAVEAGIGSRGTGVSIGPGHDGRERYTVTIGGVPWLGYRDLTWHNGTDFGAPILYDYKSTKSIEKYAKSAAELLQDLQANLYAFDTMTELDTDELLCRWVYFETDRKRQAEPRDFIVRKPEALSVIECAAEIAKELDMIDTIDQAPVNPSACPDYGGCEFHVKAGGPCNAYVPVGALIQARVPKKGSNTMPLNPANRANLAARVNGGAAPVNSPPVETAAPAQILETLAGAATSAPAGTAESAGATVDPPAQLRSRGRTRSAVGGSGSLAQIAAELTEAETAHAETGARLDAAKDAMRKALA